MDIEIKKGERLPEEAIGRLQGMMKQVLSGAEDVANAVLFAVTQPIHVNIGEIVVRPPKQLAL
jgi:NADP-dependent 3-hydroxy acid dehydrogenase YdfG